MRLFGRETCRQALHTSLWEGEHAGWRAKGYTATVLVIESSGECGHCVPSDPNQNGDGLCGGDVSDLRYESLAISYVLF